jgi:hypothetical protein
MPHPPHFFRWPRRWAGLAWVSFLTSIGLLLVQDWLGVPHPLGWPFVLLLALTAAAALLGVGWGVARFRSGGRRGSWWAIAALTPTLLWLALAVRASAGGALPNTLPMRVVTLFLASVLEAFAPVVYPRQVRTERLVMFYNDSVDQPERDAQEMDEHVARLEELTGQKLHSPIYWIRGPLARQGRMAVRGFALGSRESPRDWKTADHEFGLSVDRHELAHAVMHQIQPRDADAPTLLIEGWAEAHSGLSSRQLAEWSLLSRKLWLERKGVPEKESGSYLADLVEGDNYRRIHGPVYSVGGAFAGYLMRTYGVKAFLELYFGCRPGRFAEAVRASIGEGLDEVEERFWSAMRAEAAAKKG